MDLEEMWFQQDGVRSHTSNVTINVLETKFGECVLRKWSSRLAPSVVRFDAARLFPVGLRQDYGPCQQASDDWWTPYEHRTWNCSCIARLMLENRQKLGSSFGLLQAWPLLAMQKKLIFTHNGIERTFILIKNFIVIQNRFCFIYFVVFLLKNPLFIFFIKSLGLVFILTYFWI